MTSSAREPLLFATREGAVGTILVARSEATPALSAILLGDSKNDLVRDLADMFPEACPTETSRDARLTQACTIAADAPKAHGTLMRLPLALEGSSFQLKVWHALRDIPVGETLSYAALAERLGLATSARAIARACATNRHALAIPCHRIIRGDGTLSGYRWGIERKQRILMLERSIKAARVALASRAA